MFENKLVFKVEVD